MGFGQLFRWDQLESTAGITVWQILTHNLLIACVAALLTGSVALGMMLLNGFWLGLGITASWHLSGAVRTVELTIIHVPLEVLAWVMTVQVARELWPAVRSSRHSSPEAPELRRALASKALATALMYAVAAIAEWAALFLNGA